MRLTRREPWRNLDTDGVEDGIVTLDDSALWLVEKPVLVDRGAHLRIGPGAIVQFGNVQSDSVYAEIQRAFMQYEGRLEVAGTAERPVTIKPSDLFPDRGTPILQCPDWCQETPTGKASFAYVNLQNPIVDGFWAEHVSVTRNVPGELIRYRVLESHATSRTRRASECTQIW